MSEAIGFVVHLDTPYEETIEQVVRALKKEGFGVLTRIDVKNTFKEKLGQEFRPYSILGACNPPLAFRALSEDAVAGLLLPCNVTVEENTTGGSTVRIANPEVLLGISDLDKSNVFREVAAEARVRLERTIENLSQD